MSEFNIKVDRIKEYPQLKKEIVAYLFSHMSRKPFDKWYHYSGKFEFEGKRYDLECDCKLDRQIFSYKNLHIAHETEIIDIHQLVKDGVLTND
jgi:NADPH-dependent 2,4-dienoyl-CoA reductase/sulfur reductase-like enzyme